MAYDPARFEDDARRLLADSPLLTLEEKAERWYRILPPRPS
jgi:hypothetical protein